MTARASTVRDRLVEAARETMLSKGYSASSVDDICASAGASKGSFYHHFDSKEALALAVLDDYYTQGLGRLLDGDFTDEEDPRERLLAFLRHATEISEELWAEGCLLGSFALDLGSASPGARRGVAGMFDGLASTLDGLFHAAMEAAGRTPGTDGSPTGRDLSEHFLAVIEGSIVLAKAHDDTSRIPSGLEDFSRYVELLVG